MGKRLDSVRIQCEVVEVRQLKLQQRISICRENSFITVYFIKLFNEFGMLVCNVFLNERRGLEKFLASLASELSFIFLLDERLDGLA
jgi:hypothetical protein